MFICCHIRSIDVIVALTQFLGREISNEKLNRHLYVVTVTFNQNDDIP